MTIIHRKNHLPQVKENKDKEDFFLHLAELNTQKL